MSRDANVKDLTVAILAGGNSARFKSDKALAKFNQQPLISHMLGIAQQLSGNVLVVASGKQQKEMLERIIDIRHIVMDPEGAEKCALTGAVTAFEHANTSYVQILPIDSPLANIHLLRFLVELSKGHGAVVPIWPNGQIEPLHSVFLSEHSYQKGLKVLADRKYRMKHLLDRLSNVLYVSTNVLKEFDPNLDTFTNINTESDLRAIEKRITRSI